ncbi:hypothetical protein FHU42_003086 [Corynebacterium glutamicum]|nr:hypothetical protein [Corynebacterium glutamicum]
MYVVQNFTDSHECFIEVFVAFSGARIDAPEGASGIIFDKYGITCC